MPRIIALDYGKRRTGIAVTDPLQIIATALTTVQTNVLFEFLENYFKKEQVECLVVGEPMFMDGSAMEIEIAISEFIKKFSEKFNQIKIQRMDERFTSKIAKQTLIDSGLKKKDRKNKANLDSTSAVLILQAYLEKYP